MYKDKDKQREANRARQQRRRDVIKSKGVTNTGCDGQGVTDVERGQIEKDMVAIGLTPVTECPIPEDQRKPYINYGPYMTAHQLATAGLKFNRVSKPGDADYNGVCTEAWRAERVR